MGVEIKRYIPQGVIVCGVALLIYAAWYLGEAKPGLEINGGYFVTNKPALSLQVAQAIGLAMKETSGHGIAVSKCHVAITARYPNRVDAGRHLLPNDCVIPQSGVSPSTRTGERRPEPIPTDWGNVFLWGAATIAVVWAAVEAAIRLEKHEGRKLPQKPIRRTQTTAETPTALDPPMQSHPIFSRIKLWGEDHEAEIAARLLNDLAPVPVDAEEELKKRDAKDYATNVLRFKGNP
jgi:hypothetical protein